jgi:hypothetical protein
VSEWQPVELAELYPSLAARGLKYGDSFRGLVELWQSGQTAYGRNRDGVHAMLHATAPQNALCALPTETCVFGSNSLMCLEVTR